MTWLSSFPVKTCYNCGSFFNIFFEVGLLRGGLKYGRGIYFQTENCVSNKFGFFLVGTLKGRLHELKNETVPKKVGTARMNFYV